MFARCSSLQYLDISNFNTDNVTNMSFMFNRCSLLKDIIVNNFNINKDANKSCMLDECLDEIKKKIKKNKFI